MAILPLCMRGRRKEGEGGGGRGGRGSREVEEVDRGKGLWKWGREAQQHSSTAAHQHTRTSAHPHLSFTSLPS